MKKLKGFNFAPFRGSGILNTNEARLSLKTMTESTGSNFVIFTPSAFQQDTNSTEIDFRGVKTCRDDELIEIIEYAHELGLSVGIKPTVNLRCGMWRAMVSFIDNDVPGENTWGEWFKSYTDFQLHFANIAEKCNVEFFIAGCEMVMSEHRETEWRKLIADIRDIYSCGQVSYNTDKFQEDQITWWDCVDFISTSGYYPHNTWETELKRLEAVCRKFGKQLMFAEIGCSSSLGASVFPNKIFVESATSFEEQKMWYEKMFCATGDLDWISGYALWSWTWSLDSLTKGKQRRFGYDVYGKPALDTIRNGFAKLQ